MLAKWLEWLEITPLVRVVPLIFLTVTYHLLVLDLQPRLQSSFPPSTAPPLAIKTHTTLCSHKSMPTSSVHCSGSCVPG